MLQMLTWMLGLESQTILLCLFFFGFYVSLTSFQSYCDSNHMVPNGVLIFKWHWTVYLSINIHVLYKFKNLNYFLPRNSLACTCINISFFVKLFNLTLTSRTKGNMKIWKTLLKKIYILKTYHMNKHMHQLLFH